MAISDDRLKEIWFSGCGCWCAMDEAEAEPIVEDLRSYREAMAHLAAMWAELTPPGLDADREKRWTCYVPLLPRDRQFHYGDTPQEAIAAAWEEYRKEAQR